MLAFALGAAQDMLVLLMAQRISRGRLYPLRAALSAFFAGLAAFAARFAPLSCGIALLAGAAIACGASFGAGVGGSGVAGRLRGSALTLACAGYLGGVMLALRGAFGSGMAASLCASLLCAAVFVGALRSRCAHRRAGRVKVCCVFSGLRIELSAVVDTGNTLRDYLTHRPVIVAGSDMLRGVMLSGVRGRLIVADTAGGRQMMRLYMPDQTVIIENGRSRKVRAAIAVSPGLNCGAPALVPAQLLDE